MGNLLTITTYFYTPLEAYLQFSLINKYYPNYNPETLYDDINKEYYSLEMILNSLSDYDFSREFLKIPIFDFLIGNTDRHQNNWAIL